MFADGALAAWMIEKLRSAARADRFEVYAFCVMPDHFHALVAGSESSSDLLAFAKKLKQITAHAYKQRLGDTLWQKRFYDHILRPNDNALAIAGYIWRNPVRKGLCRDMRDYPHSGSFVLDWRKAVTPMEEWVPGWRKTTRRA